MASRPGYLWRSPTTAWAAALLALTAAAYVLARAGAPRESLALLVPLAVYSAPLVLILASRLEPGPERPSAGDLDHLLTLKRHGALPPARRPARRPGRAPVPRVTGTPGPPASPLDRLVRRKRQWAEPTDRPEEPS